MIGIPTMCCGFCKTRHEYVGWWCFCGRPSRYFSWLGWFWTYVCEEHADMHS